MMSPKTINGKNEERSINPAAGPLISPVEEPVPETENTPANIPKKEHM
jgi:hypothetical protein